jgi:hypothetical protein
MAKITKGRIVISRNIPENLALAQKIYDKHVADGNDSALNNLEDTDWSTAGPGIAICLQLCQKADDLKRQLDELYRERDNAYKPIADAIQTSKLYLKGRFAKNPKKLGEWGFNVDDTPRVRKQNKS